MLLLRNLNETLTVIITCHRYEHYLPEAIESVLRQSVIPNEIIVVDDKPEQTPTKCQAVLTNYNWPNIRYIRTDHGDPLLARKSGFEASHTKYICFLDADDQLGEDYIAAGIDRFSETDASVVYSDIEYFGKQNQLVPIPREIPTCQISISNFLHVGCLVTAEAIQTADAFNHPPLNNYHEDWFFWRKILHLGYRITKQSGLYRARKHNHNRSQNLEQHGYYQTRGLEAATITFAGSTPQTENLLVNKQDWPLSQIHLILYNQNKCQQIRCSHTISSCTDLINHAARIADTDYIFYYNESLQYQADICESLLRQLNYNIAGVHDTRYNPFECTLVSAPIMKTKICQQGIIPKDLRVLYV